MSVPTHAHLHIRSEFLDWFFSEDAAPEAFVFRLNRRTSGARGVLSYRLIQQAVVTDPGTWVDIMLPAEEPLEMAWYRNPEHQNIKARLRTHDGVAKRIPPMKTTAS